MRRLVPQSGPSLNRLAPAPGGYTTTCIVCGEAQPLTRVTEFKEIRKEWKAKKKEEEHARKQTVG